MPLTIGQTLRGRYQIQLQLGQGGFGTVYQAVDLNLQRLVAVKENLDISPAAQKQFQREAQLLVNVRHPNLPQILDYFIEPNGQQYLVMEFIAGSTLRQLVMQRGALDEAQVKLWANQILDALHELHHNMPPIIHRDIKPDNIIITPRNNAVLVDFGIAKAAFPGAPTTTGARAVSPGYSPPEQYGNAPTDARSDIYSFGATLYYVLTGIEPPESIQRLVSNVPLVPPRHYNVRLSPTIEEAIVRAMEIKPIDRWQMTNDLAKGMVTVAPQVSTQVTVGRTPTLVSRSAMTTTFPRRGNASTSSQSYWLMPLLIGLVCSSAVFFFALAVGSLIGSGDGGLLLVGLIFEFLSIAGLIAMLTAKRHRNANQGQLTWTQALIDGVLVGALFAIAMALIVSGTTLTLLVSAPVSANPGTLFLLGVGAIVMFVMGTLFSTFGALIYRLSTR